MDIITHAVTGAFTGMVFNRPLAGAIIAVTPDIVLGIRRRALPNFLYNVTHSAGFVLLLATGVWLVYADGSLALLVAAALASHIVLDMHTHGKDWAPPLLFPLTDYRDSFGNDWEWFNRSWWLGLITATLWSSICIALLLSGIGSQLLLLVQ